MLSLGWFWADLRILFLQEFPSALPPQDGSGSYPDAPRKDKGMESCVTTLQTVTLLEHNTKRNDLFNP